MVFDNGGHTPDRAAGLDRGAAKFHDNHMLRILSVRLLDAGA
jgi:hypothetical protein